MFSIGLVRNVKIPATILPLEAKTLHAIMPHAPHKFSRSTRPKKDFRLPGSARDGHTGASKKEYFEYWYGKRVDLGNITAEDGYTFRGRGAIQITGRANYRLVGRGIGQPLGVT